MTTSSQTDWPAGELVQYLDTSANSFLFSKRSPRRCRLNFVANHMREGHLAIWFAKFVVSAAQSPKVERLLWALELKALSVRSRSADGALDAPLVVGLATEITVSRFKSQFLLILLSTLSF